MGNRQYENKEIYSFHKYRCIPIQEGSKRIDMSAFFDSEIIREELGEINKLQEEVYGKLISFHMMEHDEQVEHVTKLTDLLDRQRVMYARLSLSDDPAAIEMKKDLNKTVRLMGYPEGTDIKFLFDNMHTTIEALKIFLETA